MTESGAPPQDALSPTRHGGAEPVLAAECARHIVDAFAGYNADFRAITRRAPGRFDQRDLVGSQHDAAERIDLYDRAVKSAVAQLELKLGEQAHDKTLWQAIRHEFAAAITGVPDNEFSKTFFSSITRRLFRTVGVAPEIEFVATDLDPLASVTSDIIFDTYTNRGALSLLVEDMLDELRFQSRWRDFDHSVRHVTNEIERHHGQSGERRAVQRIELIKPVFYQIGRAYLVGRVIGRGYVRPLVIALKNTERRHTRRCRDAERR